MGKIIYILTGMAIFAFLSAGAKFVYVKVVTGEEDALAGLILAGIALILFIFNKIYNCIKERWEARDIEKL